MDLITWSIFSSFFPEFANASAAVQAAVGALAPVAQVFVSAQVFPVQTQDYAQSLVIAHFLQLGYWQGGGSVIGMTVGKVSQQQAAMPTDKTDFNMTSYGKRYLSLGRVFRTPVLFAGGGSYQIPPYGNRQPTWS